MSRSSLARSTGDHSYGPTSSCFSSPPPLHPCCGGGTHGCEIGDLATYHRAGRFVTGSDHERLAPPHEVIGDPFTCAALFVHDIAGRIDSTSSPSGVSTSDVSFAFTPRDRYSSTNSAQPRLTSSTTTWRGAIKLPVSHHSSERMKAVETHRNFCANYWSSANLEN